MTDLLSLQDLFNKRIFRIPDYQRGYSWNIQQLTEFWEDIVNLPQDREHYTGMISLKKLDRETTQNWNDEKWLLDNRGYNAYHVVDGQQRLTTCIVLLNEIVTYLKEMEENKEKRLEDIFLNSTRLSEVIEEYLVIVKPDSEKQLKTYKFGYEVDNPSYEFFKYKILGETNPRDIQETFYTLNLEIAKKFFRKTIGEIHDKKEIEELYIKLTQKIKFNLYDIDDDFNVFIAFETMNNRGKKLSNLELLKNRLIYLTTLFDVKKDVSNKVREKINDTWKTVYGFLGKNKEKALNDDEFLQAHWIIYFGYNRKTRDSYTTDLLNNYFSQKRVLNIVEQSENVQNIEMDEATIDEEIELDDNDTTQECIAIDKTEKLKISDIGNYIDSMKFLIPFWYDLNFPKLSGQDERIKFWLITLNRLGYVYFKPLTAVVLSKSDISIEEKIKYLKLVERFIFMHFRLAGYFSTYKNSYYYNLAHELYIGKKNILDVFKELENIDYLRKDNIIKVTSVLPKFERFFKNYKGYYSWNSIRYVLYEYETYLMSGQANQKIYPEDIFKKDDRDKVSIEHIYPQSDDKAYWQERFDMYDEYQKKCLSGTIGNLLPLSMSINSSLQNDSFDDKKNRHPRGYSNGSHSEIEVSKCEEWTANEILDRGIKILDFMAQRWSFKFKTRKDKEKLLFLDFLTSYDPALEDEVEEIEEEIVEKTHNKTKITIEMVKYLYEVFRMIEVKKIDKDVGIFEIAEKTGMNIASIKMYMNSLEHMLVGDVYTRRVAADDLEYFLNKIKEDYGIEKLVLAIASVEKHLEYGKRMGMKPPPIFIRIIEKYKNEI